MCCWLSASWRADPRRPGKHFRLGTLRARTRGGKGRPHGRRLPALLPSVRDGAEESDLLAAQPGGPESRGARSQGNAEAGRRSRRCRRFEDPPAFEKATAQDLLDARRPLPPTELAADADSKNFDLRGDARKLFEDVARAFGLDCMFDGDYQPVPPFRFQMNEVDYRTALHALERATSSFIVPLTSKLFLVVRDTPQKRTEVEPYVAVAVHVPETLTPQDFNAMVTAVQQTFAVEKVAFDSANSTVILKGAISKIVPARAMFEDLMYPRAQVMVEVRFVEVSRNDLLTYGVDITGDFPFPSSHSIRCSC